jgi:hypothetical protein
VKRILPYLFIIVAFFSLLLWKHPESFNYRLNQETVKNYLRSQDIEDPEGNIKDRILVSDSDIYISSGYLYTKGEDPTKYNFQHPPLVKYLFGFSTLLTGNPFFTQIILGLVFLFLTYFLGLKLFKNKLIALGGTFLLLIDPVFGGMMNEALLDLGQAVFALSYVILIFFYPKSHILTGIVLGLFAASKFWTTALVVVALVYFYKLVIRKEKLVFRNTLLSFVIAFLVFSLTYIKTFIDTSGTFNIFSFLAKDLRFMLTHNSAQTIGGPIVLFVSGYFIPWWQTGVERAKDWFILWPVGMTAGIIMAIKKKLGGIESFFYLFPVVHLLLMSTQVPFSRYFILILPFIYLNLVSLIASMRSK